MNGHGSTRSSLLKLYHTTVDAFIELVGLCQELALDILFVTITIIRWFNDFYFGIGFNLLYLFHMALKEYALGQRRGTNVPDVTQNAELFCQSLARFL